MSETIQLSPQQEAVRCAFKNPLSGNLMVEAVAGSGKTFTLLEVSKVLPGATTTAFMAFSKDISVEIEEKVAAIRAQLRTRMFVGTCHSFGFRAWKQFIGDKKAKLVQIMKKTEKATMLMDMVTLTKFGTTRKGVPDELRKFVTRGYILARQWGAGCLPTFAFNDVDAWMRLVDHFDMEDDLISDEDNIPTNLDEMLREGINWIVRMIKLGASRDIADRFVDFEDMIYLCLFHNVKIKWTYDNVLVDEAQDLNPTRQALAGRFVKPGGRMIFVGDPHQAIFGFTGADSDSIATLTAMYKCSVMPLSVSFRCSQNGVKFVQQWVSHIEAHPNAALGIAPPMPEATLTTETMIAKGLTKDDAVLCRNNAPLVELFFQLLKMGIPSHIEGRDIGGELIKMLDKFPKIKGWDTLQKRLAAHKEKEVKRLTDAGKEEKADRIADIIDAILAIMEAMPATSKVADIRNKITSMFQDTQGKKAETLTLTSIHKSKGREWNRVFWYGRNRWNPSPYARKDWQMGQEVNLMYVAGTRAKTELYDVHVPKPAYKAAA